MKIKNSFVLHSLGGKNMVMPTGEDAENLGGALTLSETGAFMWKILIDGATEEELCKKVFDEYNVDEQTLKKDVSEFIEKLKSFGVLE